MNLWILLWSCLWIQSQQQDYLSLSKEALHYCRTRRMDTTFYILADMRIHSGKKRLFVWDFAKQAIIDSALVSHGCCEYTWGADYSRENPKFSNTPGSLCSPAGKYKISERGQSSWGVGIKYTLLGLEKTNSLALERNIVLHSWEEITDEEVYPDGTPESWGCPAISNTFMLKLDDLLKKRKTPVLLWIYHPKYVQREKINY